MSSAIATVTPQELSAELAELIKQAKEIKHRTRFAVPSPEYEDVDDCDWWKRVTTPPNINPVSTRAQRRRAGRSVSKVEHIESLMPYPDFAPAYRDVKTRTQDLLCGPFATWALKVVQTFGRGLFATDYPDPSTFIRRSKITGAFSFADQLTETRNTIEAGSRVIFWAAAYQSNDFCGRESAHVARFACWTASAITFESNEVRFIADVMEWVRLAYDHLSSRYDPASDEAECQSKTMHKSKLSSGNTHSPCFRSVIWNGQSFALTKQQAACVKQYWQAYDKGTPALSDEHVLEEAQVSQDQIRHVFRHSPAWRTMIVQGEAKGTHRLAENLAIARQVHAKRTPNHT
jgi:hypothetical protein